MNDGDDTTAAWLMLGITVAFKLGMTIWILCTYPSAQNFILNAALNWPWLILLVVIVVALLAAPILFRIRCVRVRRKRARLQHAEWNVG